jgi:hypothetical protein
VFQTSNAALQDQLAELQRQLASPEAATPSFVAKQRRELAAADKAHAGLAAENARLQAQAAQLRLALQAAVGGQIVDGGDEQDALAAAERMLRASADRGTSAAGASDGGDWKVAEIQRLQEESRLLQSKVGRGGCTVSPWDSADVCGASMSMDGIAGHPPARLCVTPLTPPPPIPTRRWCRCRSACMSWRR